MKNRQLFSRFLITAVALVLLTIALAPIPTAAANGVYINEIQVSTSGTDWEFFELQGTPGTDLSALTLIGVESDNGASAGTIDVVISLAGQTMPADGFWLGISATGAGIYGVIGELAISDNSFENSTATYFLVSDFTGAQGDDLDTDNDGVLDSTPWGAIADAINLRDSGPTDFDYGAPSVGPDGSFLPSGTYRCPDAPLGSFGSIHSFGTPDGTPGESNRTQCGIAAIYINEIQVSTSGTDWEFFELQGAAGGDLSTLTLIGVESDNGSSAGTIDVAISLAGQTMPADGFWLGISPAGASTYGVAGELNISNNSFENSTATYFLVSDFTGAQGDDLDTNNDGVLDVTPWAAIVDAINLRDGGATDFDYGMPSVGPDGTFLPSGTYRCPDAPLGTFGNIHNFGSPDGTPGVANNNCPQPTLNISEIRIDQPGSDNDEYFELAGSAGGLLDGLSYIVIGDGTGGSGVVENVTDLSGQSIGSSGFFVAAESSFSLGTADLTTNLNFENSDNVTHLLVRDFSGSNGQDLDTDDDGTLDSAPWSAIVDCVSLVESVGSGDQVYCSPQVGPDGSFVPGQVYLCDDGWRIGEFSTGVSDTPGADNPCDVLFTGQCGDPATLISDIQGTGLASPLAGTPVVIEGVVVGDFQDNATPDNGDLDGFYVQEEDSDADADPLSSEGIFVFDDGFGIDVALGDRVRVNGVATEFFDQTEITSVIDVLVCDSGNSVTAANLTLPYSSVDDLEPYEGMSVLVAQVLSISEFFNFDRFGEIVLSTERQFQPTAVHEPGSPEAAQLAADNQLNRIKLDDGRSSQNPDPAIHPNGAVFSLTNTFRGGDLVKNVAGVMDYRFGEYRIQPTAGAEYNPENQRPEAPEDVGGSLRVASFNVLNYFTTIDTGAPICGPAGNLGCRGADTPEEFARQRAKIISALVTIDADVVGLIELENNDSAAIADLVSGVNDIMGPDTYAYVDTGTIGTDAIKVGFIYKPATVSLVGDYAILDSTVDSRFIDSKNRPALAQSFYDNSTRKTFTVVVNHLKSKGSPCDSLGDPDLGDGAGNCNLTRTMAAEAMVDWLATDPTGSGSPNVLIIGDLNSYDKEDPIDALLEGADDVLETGDDFVDLMFSFQGELEYSYVFDGQLGYLDYALANREMLYAVTGVTAWHINADEPDILDYDMSYKQDAQDALYEPNAYRSSDHDPVIVGLDLGPIINADGCYVVALEDSPFEGKATEVPLNHRSVKRFRRWLRFSAPRWAQLEGLPIRSCFEVHGTNGRDIINTGIRNDVLFGYGGRDILRGRSGNDTFTGGADRDWFIGGGGYDTVTDYKWRVDRCLSIEEGC